MLVIFLVELFKNKIPSSHKQPLLLIVSLLMHSLEQKQEVQLQWTHKILSQRVEYQCNQKLLHQS